VSETIAFDWQPLYDRLVDSIGVGGLIVEINGSDLSLGYLARQLVLRSRKARVYGVGGLRLLGRAQGLFHTHYFPDPAALLFVRPIRAASLFRFQSVDAVFVAEMPDLPEERQAVLRAWYDRVVPGGVFAGAGKRVGPGIFVPEGCRNCWQEEVR
jgi:hypothetical protein